MAGRRTFAIVPAAGESARMGAPKLLLPWGDATVIDQVLAAWRASRVERVVVVARAADDELLVRCASSGVELVTTSGPTPDMKASVRLALEHIERRWQPTQKDAWLLAPADLPRLSAAAIDAVIGASHAAPEQIVAPVYAGRRGHPTLFPWSFAEQAAQLRPSEGINALLAAAPVHEVPWQDDSIVRDVNTPGDYAAAASSLES
jgi:molybdenum cofactor cytidylyltransferase